MKKQSHFVFIPTDKKTLISLTTDGALLLNEPIGICQHLYILSDDEIKEGDWHFNKLAINSPKGGPIEKASKNVASNWARNMSYNDGKSFLRDDYKKIIATTNPELIKDGVSTILQSDIEHCISLHSGKGKEVVSDALPKNVEKYISTANEWEKVLLRNFYKWIQNNQCLQDNADKKFTLNDIDSAIDKATITMPSGDHYYTKAEIINSLTKEQQKRDTVMVEYERYLGTGCNGIDFYSKPKLNKDGNIIIVR